jgi:hypothetical protein
MILYSCQTASILFFIADAMFVSPAELTLSICYAVRTCVIVLAVEGALVGDA